MRFRAADKAMCPVFVPAILAQPQFAAIADPTPADSDPHDPVGGVGVKAVISDCMVVVQPIVDRGVIANILIVLRGRYAASMFSLPLLIASSARLNVRGAIGRRLYSCHKAYLQRCSFTA
jgi:hypothetical protein